MTRHDFPEEFQFLANPGDVGKSFDGVHHDPAEDISAFFLGIRDALVGLELGDRNEGPGPSPQGG